MKSETEQGVNTFSWIMSYLFYFIGILLLNMLLLSFYVMEVSTDHRACKTRGGRNITTKYELLFQAGLIILLVDGVNNLFNIYLRFKVQLDG